MSLLEVMYPAPETPCVACLESGRRCSISVPALGKCVHCEKFSVSAKCAPSTVAQQVVAAARAKAKKVHPRDETKDERPPAKKQKTLKWRPQLDDILVIPHRDAAAATASDTEDGAEVCFAVLATALLTRLRASKEQKRVFSLPKKRKRVFTEERHLKAQGGRSWDKYAKEHGLAAAVAAAGAGDNAPAADGEGDAQMSQATASPFSPDGPYRRMQAEIAAARADDEEEDFVPREEKKQKNAKPDGLYYDEKDAKLPPAEFRKKYTHHSDRMLSCLHCFDKGIRCSGWRPGHVCQLCVYEGRGDKCTAADGRRRRFLPKDAGALAFKTTVPVAAAKHKLDGFNYKPESLGLTCHEFFKTHTTTREFTQSCKVCFPERCSGWRVGGQCWQCAKMQRSPCMPADPRRIKEIPASPTPVDQAELLPAADEVAAAPLAVEPVDAAIVEQAAAVAPPAVVAQQAAAAPVGAALLDAVAPAADNSKDLICPHTSCGASPGERFRKALDAPNAERCLRQHAKRTHDCAPESKCAACQSIREGRTALLALGVQQPAAAAPAPVPAREEKKKEAAPAAVPVPIGEEKKEAAAAAPVQAREEAAAPDSMVCVIAGVVGQFGDDFLVVWDGNEYALSESTVEPAEHVAGGGADTKPGLIYVETMGYRSSAAEAAAIRKALFSTVNHRTGVDDFQIKLGDSDQTPFSLTTKPDGIKMRFVVGTDLPPVGAAPRLRGLMYIAMLGYQSSDEEAKAVTEQFLRLRGRSPNTPTSIVLANGHLVDLSKPIDGTKMKILVGTHMPAEGLDFGIAFAEGFGYRSSFAESAEIGLRLLTRWLLGNGDAKKQTTIKLADARGTTYDVLHASSFKAAGFWLRINPQLKPFAVADAELKSRAVYVELHGYRSSHEEAERFGETIIRYSVRAPGYKTTFALADYDNTVLNLTVSPDAALVRYLMAAPPQQQQPQV